uniref:Uncharacterized protein n=1 Tax=Nelumbo nucifera TaxID=4432 RepID=A0A822ZIP2_NELNU|nr:TPA_asm: hypothetical protein HUJ06_003232 [Nelumbo nucifera]
MLDSDFRVPVHITLLRTISFPCKLQARKVEVSREIE